MASQKLVLLAQDDKTVSLAVIPAPTSHAAASFRLIVNQRYRRCGGTAADDGAIDDEVDTMEDVACHVPIGELCAATIDRAFQDLVSMLDHPTLRPEVAPAAREAVARVRSRLEEEAQPGEGVEFRLCVEFIDSLETDNEETGSDLELDEESWEHGCLSDNGDWRDQGPAILISDDEDEDGGAQFSARPFDGALAREGRPSDGTLLLLSGFEARADGPELADQHELTPRDVQRLVRLALHGGDMEDDDAYQRALDGGAPVSRVTRAVLLDQGLRSATATARPQQQQQTTSPRGMPDRMRTGW